MTVSPDVIVVGPGGMGSAAARHLAVDGHTDHPTALFDPRRFG